MKANFLIATSQWEYCALVVDLTECESLQDVARHVERSVESVPGGDSKRLVCHVTLRGSPEFDLDLELLREEVTTKAYVRYTARLSLSYDLELLAEEQTVRGMLVRRFLSHRERAYDALERRTMRNALNHALQALDGKQVRPNEVD